MTSQTPRSTLDLNGQWLFALDPDDIGIEQGCLAGSLSATIRVPGSWEEQGFGDPPTAQPLGTWSKHHQYEGAAWYSCSLEIPAAWAGQSVFLTLKSVRWQSQVWVEDALVGVQESLSTPHRYDLTPFVQPGSTYRLTVRVDNRLLYPLKESHANSEHTATRWGGISGGALLEAVPPLALEHIVCRPNISERCFEVDVTLPSAADHLTLTATLTDPETGAVYTQSAGFRDGRGMLSVRLGDAARLWWDDDPFLYDAEFTLHEGETVIDRVQKRVGLREISVHGADMLLNGQPVFLRGYIDCCIFPQTGYPSWEIDDYRRQFAIARSYGFNHVRLHSWTAPEPFWEAADEAGMLVQAELPHWSRLYDDARQPPPDSVQQFLSNELERIVAALHFHPSWVLFSQGNELLGGMDWHPALNALVEQGRQLDDTRLYADNTGFGQLPAPSRQTDFYIQSCNWHPPKKIYDSASNDTTQDFSAITALADAPLLAHEHGQFTMYVRPQEAEKYTGVIYPAWLDYVRETLDAKRMNGRIDDFIRATGTHIVRTYKENIERGRRTRGLAGIQLLDIRDFPGQGHATTGILDVFWDSKGLIEPERFAEFNGAVVLLMRAPAPMFWNGRTLEVELEVSNFGHETLTGVLEWELRSAQTTLRGQLDVPSAPAGGLKALGRLAISLPADGEAAYAWELVVTFGGARNRWHLWSYPSPRVNARMDEVSARLPELRPVLPGANFSDDFLGIGIFTEGKLPPSSLVISERLTGRVLQHLHDGGTVWLMPGAKQLHGAVPTRYLPPFWSYLWFPDNFSNVMGMIIHDHPLLRRFPHDGMSDWQWYSLVNDAPAICLDALPVVEPIVEVVDNFSRVKRLCYAFEARVGAGKLFVSTFRFTDSAVMIRPEARFLFSETTQYLMSESFAPTQRLTVGDMLGLFRLTNGNTFDME